MGREENNMTKMPNVGVQTYIPADKVMLIDKVVDERKKADPKFSRNALINEWIDEKLKQGGVANG